MSTFDRIMICPKCAYEWTSKSKRNDRITCPRCRGSISLNNKVKHSILLELNDKHKADLKAALSQGHRVLILDYVGTRVTNIAVIEHAKLAAK